LGPELRGVVMFLSVFAIAVVVAALVLTILYRNTKTLVSSSPLFLMLILFGALLLAISPFFVYVSFCKFTVRAASPFRPDVETSTFVE
jgi:hypothetical protein